MTKYLLFLGLFLNAAPASPENGSLTFIYQTTDRELYGEIQYANRWRNFFTLADDPVAAAWFAGYAAHAQMQFDESHKL